MYYIKNSDGSYYRNDQAEAMPSAPVWVKEKAEASLCSTDRATILIAFWQSEGFELEQYQLPEAKKLRKDRE